MARPPLRTRTGLLEEHLVFAQTMERLGRSRLAAADRPDDAERHIAQTVVQHAVGLQRALERWIAYRCARDMQRTA